MANRCLLAKTRLEEFKQWLIAKGWKIQEPKGEYEVLRAINKEIRKKPLIIFTRIDAKVHYSIQDSDTGIIREFLAEGRENDVN